MDDIGHCMIMTHLLNSDLRGLGMQIDYMNNFFVTAFDIALNKIRQWQYYPVDELFNRPKAFKAKSPTLEFKPQ